MGRVPIYVQEREKGKEEKKTPTLGEVLEMLKENAKECITNLDGWLPTKKRESVLFSVKEHGESIGAATLAIREIEELIKITEALSWLLDTNIKAKLSPHGLGYACALEWCDADISTNHLHIILSVSDILVLPKYGLGININDDAAEVLRYLKTSLAESIHSETITVRKLETPLKHVALSNLEKQFGYDIKKRPWLLNR